MKALILAGGFGTRLKSVVSDVPKPMAPIRGKPFLAYLVDDLLASGVSEIIFSLYYMPEVIQTYFFKTYPQGNFKYIVEPEPLGTGGAIVYAMNQCEVNEPLLILNGDSYLAINYREFYNAHIHSQADLSIVLRAVPDTARYGKVDVIENKITCFSEKNVEGSGLINAGIYLIRPDLFKPYDLPRMFSLENDFFKPYISKLQANPFVSKGYFIDIGIPEDYQRAELGMLPF